MSADAFAVGHTIANTIMHISEPEPEWKSFFSTPEQRLFVWCFAISGLFHLWGIKINLSTIHKDTHPPTAMRFLMALNRAGQIISQIDPGLVNSFKNIALNAQVQCANAIVLIGGQPPIQSDWDPLFSSKGLARHKQIQKHWIKSVLPQLRTYSYVEIPDIPAIS
jgi:hypothetical protein